MVKTHNRGISELNTGFCSHDQKGRMWMRLKTTIHGIIETFPLISGSSMRTAHGKHQSSNHLGAELTPSTHSEAEWAGGQGS